MSIGSLFLKLGLSIANEDISNLDRMQNKVTALSTAFIASKDAVQIAVVGINKFIGAGMASTASLESFKNVTGNSITELNRFVYALRMGYPTISWQQGISMTTGLIQNMSKALIGTGGNLRLYALTGIDFEKNHRMGKDLDTLKQLGQILGQNTNLSRSLRTELLASGGIDQRSLPGLIEYGKNAGKPIDNVDLPSESLARTQKLTQAQVALDASWQKLTVTATGALAPALITINNNLTWLFAHLGDALNSFGNFAESIKKEHPTLWQLVVTLTQVGLSLKTIWTLSNKIGKTFGWIKETPKAAKTTKTVMGKGSLVGEIIHEAELIPNWLEKLASKFPILEKFISLLKILRPLQRPLMFLDVIDSTRNSASPMYENKKSKNIFRQEENKRINYNTLGDIFHLLTGSYKKNKGVHHELYNPAKQIQDYIDQTLLNISGGHIKPIDQLYSQHNIYSQHNNTNKATNVINNKHVANAYNITIEHTGNDFNGLMESIKQGVSLHNLSFRSEIST